VDFKTLGRATDVKNAFLCLAVLMAIAALLLNAIAMQVGLDTSAILVSLTTFR
jgi:hypothetical protein